MTDDTRTVAVRLPAAKAEAFAQSVENDEQFDTNSEVLTHLIDRWLAGEVW